MNEFRANVDAERAVLGAMLMDGSSAVKQAAAVGLQAEEFSLDSHRVIYGVMCHLGSDVVDLITVSDELRNRKQEDYIGGLAYLCSLTDGVPLRSNIENHVRIIKREALARTIQNSLSGMLAEISESDPQKLITRLAEEVRRLGDTGAVTTGNRFVGGTEFFSKASTYVDWLVEGIIQRGANGFIAGEPKSSKSWAAIDLAISLATGSTWLGRRVPRPVKVAVISREDAPALTSWRGRNLALTRERQGTSIDLIAENLWFNTREQSNAFSLDHPQQVMEMVRDLKSHQIEFAIFDVFNVLHGADENDAQQMSKVLAVLSRIQAEAGCSIGVVHHLNKGEGSLMKRLRGSSAIAGWTEWLIGITLEDEESGLRRLNVIGKAAASIQPIYYTIHSEEADGTCRLLLADAPQAPSQSTLRHRPI